MKGNYQNWTTSMMESWKKLEGAKTAYLFSEDVEYYETLDAPPCASFIDVVKLWEVVPVNQSDISYKFEVISANEECGIINWIMHRTFKTNTAVMHQYIDGIFQIKLNNEGKCCFFKQWRFTKTETEDKQK